MNATSSTAGRVHADALDHDDEAERGRERVGGSRRGDADDDVREVADRALFQALVHDPGGCRVSMRMRRRCRWPSRLLPLSLLDAVATRKVTAQDAPLPWTLSTKVTALDRRRPRGAIPKTRAAKLYISYNRTAMLTRCALRAISTSTVVLSV